MQDVIYDVNVSIDGFICGPGGDIAMFPTVGPMVEEYIGRLAEYHVAIMGRTTYEFGYRFGMLPGNNPYPQMRTIVYSKSLDLPVGKEIEVVSREAPAHVEELKQEGADPIYLCGGGAFAAALLRAGVIDRLRLKRSPVLVGSGTRLFVENTLPLSIDLVSSRVFPDGGVYQEYRLL